MNYYELFTDGGCWPNPGPGGWAFIVTDGRNRIGKACGVERNTTNNRMELTAAIKGLHSLPNPSTVILHSDSEYVVKGINQWSHNWRNRGWVGVMNTDLWKPLDELVSKNNVMAVWVRGHSGHPENEECDQMCFKAYKNMKEKSNGSSQLDSESY